MIFEFILINTPNKDSAMYLTDLDHDWPGQIETKTVARHEIVGNVKGRSTFHIADAMHDGYTPEMFAQNNIIMLADRVPAFSDSPAFWANILRSHAIACDYWTWEQIKDMAPTISHRHINLTGVNMTTYEPPNVHSDDPPNDGIVYAGPDDGLLMQLRSYIEHTSFQDRPDGSKINVESIEEANVFANYNVLFAPKAHSSLWLAAMAHRSNLVLHEFEPVLSYHLDPRGNSSTLSTLNAEKVELSGGAPFKRRIENLMDEYPALVESLVSNPYRRPVGEKLVNRLFAEVNRSMY